MGLAWTKSARVCLAIKGTSLIGKGLYSIHNLFLQNHKTHMYIPNSSKPFCSSITYWTKSKNLVKFVMWQKFHLESEPHSPEIFGQSQGTWSLSLGACLQCSQTSSVNMQLTFYIK